MSYEEAVRSITLNADSSIAVYTGVPGMAGSAAPNSGFQYRFVKVTGAKTAGLAVGADNEIVVGVMQNKPQVTGQAATVAIRGVVSVQVGADVDAGESVMTDDAGRATPATLPDDANKVLGVALESGVSGTIIPVLLITPVNTSLIPVV